ncbi:hypothetical protein F1737_07055 [Methanoplanus sp. FWC-SCC4]|uniref:Uncharacterized protein n=1 Tax=Methanochimaera problematica TaxID=2609417 RepID=A0AA97FBP9_9EURY|nr:hypothetical protein [Methanoplanus sp. FWC-SCC4]WOF16475.1 hypothetical protein F1737_07055 [Methanoplanus sp. FWC-SCC4]
MAMKKNSTIFLASVLICAALFGIFIITISYSQNNSSAHAEDSLINDSKKSETDPRIDKTKKTCVSYYNSNLTILKEYGNWSERTYYEYESWNAIRPPHYDFDKYWWASKGGPVNGYGPDSCLGGISVWWDPDIPVNETIMDEVYSLFADSAKAAGMKEPYLTFIPGKLYPD